MFIIIIMFTFFRVSLIPSCKAGLLNTKTLFDYAVYPGRRDAQGRRQKKPSVSFYNKNRSSQIMDLRQTCVYPLSPWVRY